MFKYNPYRSHQHLLCTLSKEGGGRKRQYSCVRFGKCWKLLYSKYPLPAYSTIVYACMTWLTYQLLNAVDSFLNRFSREAAANIPVYIKLNSFSNIGQRVFDRASAVFDISMHNFLTNIIIGCLVKYYHLWSIALLPWFMSKNNGKLIIHI